MSERLTDTEIFMRDMSKMDCGCSMSGYVRCDKHKHIPHREDTYTQSELNQALAIQCTALLTKLRDEVMGLQRREYEQVGSDYVFDWEMVKRADGDYVLFDEVLALLEKAGE